MLIAVDKPKWISSFDVIRALKRELWEKKVGHSWTLDPMATWLLLIWTWKDTKQLHELIWLDKSYITTIDFSKISDTRDMDYRKYFEELKIIPLWRGTKGVQNNNNKIPAPTIEQIKNKLNTIIPEYSLPLTPFSAKKKDGKKLYELAREWKQTIENKKMKTNWYEIIKYEFPILELKLDVWSGTYIRSIWYRLWKELGIWWLLTTLRRTIIWKYNLENIKLDQTATFFIKKDGKDKWEIEFKYWIL